MKRPLQKTISQVKDRLQKIATTNRAREAALTQCNPENHQTHETLLVARAIANFSEDILYAIEHDNFMFLHTYY